MTREEKLEWLKDLVQRDEPILPETVLAEMPEWDSLSILGFIAMSETRFARKITRDQVVACRTAADLLRLLD